MASSLTTPLQIILWDKQTNAGAKTKGIITSKIRMIYNADITMELTLMHLDPKEIMSLKHYYFMNHKSITMGYLHLYASQYMY